MRTRDEFELACEQESSMFELTDIEKATRVYAEEREKAEEEIGEKDRRIAELESALFDIAEGDAHRNLPVVARRALEKT